MTNKQVVHRHIYVLLALIIFVVALVGGRVISPAFADTDNVTAFENSNVFDDLKKSTIAGNAFNLDDYPYVEDGCPRIIAFVEFGFSLQSDKQSDYGLYVYVYNPQNIAIDTIARNTIQFTYGNSKTPQKHPLEFLNYSNAPGYEGRFYKYRVRLSSSEKLEILTNITRNGRVYKVSGITLSYKTEVTEYLCAQTYTYTGFALGYGSELAETDTLSCVVDGFDTYLELNVKHTEYRAKGDYYYGEQSQLNSVYLRVPNRFFESYGDITAIECEWWEYFTKPLLVVKPGKAYDDIAALYGRPFSALTDIPLYYLFLINWQVESNWFGGGNGKCAYGSNMNLKGKTFDYDYFTGWIRYNFTSDPFDRFAAVFKSDNALTDDLYIDGDTVLEKLRSNSEKLGGEKINDRYSRELFEDYVQDGYSMGYNHVLIKSDDKQDFFWNKTKCSDFWQKRVTGQVDVSTEHENLPAIITVGENDVAGSDAEVSQKLYINKLDVSDLKKEIAIAKANDETVVLLRFSSTKYFAAKGVYAYTTDSHKKVDDIVEDIADMEHEGKTNCLAVQQTVYLDFDVISFTYTNNSVNTAIPAVMSPTDISGGITPALKESTDGNFWDWLKRNWYWIPLILVGIVLIIVFFPVLLPLLLSVLPYIGKGLLWLLKGLWWLICLPFKGIAALVRKIKEGRGTA